VPQEPNEFSSLHDWLRYIEKVNSKEIELDLNRIDRVYQTLNIKFDFPIITVAGTNGKGSTCAFLESIYSSAKYNVACYTSPHLFKFNERIKVNKVPCCDQDIVNSLNLINSKRQGVPLTYFEITTLAAMHIFFQKKVDVAILEIGLGGRLDAVNLFDPEVSIITSIALDHQDFLGNTVEEIALEKGGIFRPNKHAIINTKNDKNILVRYGEKINSQVSQLDKDYSIKDNKDSFSYLGGEYSFINLPYPKLEGNMQIQNLAGVLRVVELLEQKLPVTKESIELGILNTNLIGRLDVVSKKPLIVFDVAHNQEAANNLSEFIVKSKNNGRVFGVFSILLDKDIDSVIMPFIKLVDEWFISSIDHTRAQKVDVIKLALKKMNKSTPIHIADNLLQAYKNAYKKTALDDNIIVFGSFFTVREIIKENYND
jgi:dihydrofolate synthase/folylpolyglutamate synthase